MRLLTLILTLIFFSGCYNAKKAVRQTNRAILNYRTEIAKITRDVFPCDTSKVTQSENITDTLIEVYCPENDYADLTKNDLSENANTPLQFGKKKIPVWVKVPMYRYYITQHVKDNGDVEYYKGREEKMQAKIEKYESDNRSDRKLTNGLWIAVVTLLTAVGLMVVFRK